VKYFFVFVIKLYIQMIEQIEPIESFKGIESVKKINDNIFVFRVKNTNLKYKIKVLSQYDYEISLNENPQTYKMKFDNTFVTRPKTFKYWFIFTFVYYQNIDYSDQCDNLTKSHSYKKQIKKEKELRIVREKLNYKYNNKHNHKYKNNINVRKVMNKHVIHNKRIHQPGL